ncbi:hypothetical protein Pint_12277 [Pistacia integerrima]|uniref:Uncharacterized protein n=1 Tax=Pistacia integerrima TaxID=434235 RepID=A0ACC0XJZ9_9ROSI|nr:hypothetical protein Pint_12277 [Pistacia integerrima]
MATNDQVTVDIPPQIDELHEIENELVTSLEEHNVMDTRTALPNQSSHEEIIEIMTSPPQDEAHNPTRIDELYDTALKKFCEAAESNDWKKAYEEVFRKDLVKNSEYLTARGEDLAAKNTDGNTAFFLIAKSKDVRLVKQMLNKNRKLSSIRGANEMLSINMVAQSGHEEVVRFCTEIAEGETRIGHPS